MLCGFAWNLERNASKEADRRELSAITDHKWEISWVFGFGEHCFATPSRIISLYLLRALSAMALLLRATV